MTEIAAVKAALNLLHLPATVRRLQAEPLPHGVDVLLKVVAGDDELVRELAGRTERSPAMLRQASAFFIEQILLAPGANPYRALGASSGTPPADLRRNMALLLRWLHPDVAHDDERKRLAERVTAAWEKVKTSERRSDFDTGAGLQPAEARRSKDARSKRPTGRDIEAHIVRRAIASGEMSDVRGSWLLRMVHRLLGR